jgi:outer membrane protein OmpA-like peptidoglycan-associated protein
MAQRVGKCTNYSGCKLAYRNEKITVVTKDFRCPECGSPLEPVGPKKGAPYTLYVLIGVGAVLLFAVGAIIWTLTNSPRPHVVLVQESPTPVATPAVAAPTPMPAPSAAVAAAATETPPATTPEPVATPAGPLNFDTSTPEIAAVRREVLRRIESSPYPQAQKDRAYELVDKAHGMGRLFTVSFETAITKLPPQEVSLIQNTINQPQIKKVLDDPAVVLVILGFADQQGADIKNQQLSQGRAQATLDLLRDKCGVLNVMYPIAMGGTNIFDAKELAKNRIVEVWAVLP